MKFFKQGQDPIDCNVRDEAGLVEFLNQNCGTHRTLNGGLTASAGRIPELDAVVAKFLKSPSQKFVDEIKNAAKNVQGKYKDYYGKAMEKVLKDGNYLSKEIQRLEKLIGADGVIPEKLDDFISRKNILSLFAGDAPQVEL